MNAISKIKRCFYALVFAAAMTRVSLGVYAEIPDNWVGYVESTGSQWVDAGIIGKSGTTIEFKETCLCNDTDEHCVIGARNSTSNRFFMWYHAAGHHVGLGYGGTYWRPIVYIAEVLAVRRCR